MMALDGSLWHQEALKPTTACLAKTAHWPQNCGCSRGKRQFTSASL